MRVAVFVDAGYLHAAGSVVLKGSAQNRESMELRRHEIIAKLKASTEEQTDGAPLLRIYWYDGLMHRRRSQEQESMAIANDVKVRLGTVTGGRQKGVDSLIVTDLIELARNQVISDAVLLAGDEDLRIGVQIAQSFGVRVHLIGIEPSRGNQSNLLREEADTTTEWSKGDIKEIMSVKSGLEVLVETPPSPIWSSDSGNDTGKTLDEVATEVVNSINTNELSGVAGAMSQSPQLMIPYDYDRRLLSEGKSRLGRDLDEPEKHRLRDKFKATVENRVQQTAEDVAGSK